MNGTTITFKGGPIFDGTELHHNAAARFEDGTFAELIQTDDLRYDAPCVDLHGDILSPGYVDLQVNGGGGVMFNDAPSVATLRRIAAAHRSLGVSQLLPTLITDTPEKTEAAIAAATAALDQGVPGIAGLHLEGPHLCVARKGAHDAALIRPMEDIDLQRLLTAKKTIPRLKVTVAPENVTPEQVSTLAQAGVLVSLGHSDADFATCQDYASVGARCVTHLFNAMSQLGNRTPGLVGAALANGALSAGLIADAVHVHPATMQTAWYGKAAPGKIFLVSDAMAVAGTDQHEFYLEGRHITRQNGRLTLADETLAGADLDLTTAVRVLVSQARVDLTAALCAATTVPGDLINLPVGLRPGSTPLSGLNRIASDLSGVTPLGPPYSAA